MSVPKTIQDIRDLKSSKVDKVTGKGLSTNDYDNTEKQKVTTAYDSVLRVSRYFNISMSGNDTTGDGSSAKPYRTIAKAISMIPKSLGGNIAYLYISGGNYDEHVSISERNDGTIIITGPSGATVRIYSLEVINSVCEVDNISLSIVSTSKNAITVYKNGYLVINPAVTISGSSAINIFRGGRFIAYGTLTLSITGSGIGASGSSNVFVRTIQGTVGTTGMNASDGSIIAFSTNNLSAAGTMYITSTSGRIYSGSQVNIPNY